MHNPTGSRAHTQERGCAQVGVCACNRCAISQLGASENRIFLSFFAFLLFGVVKMRWRWRCRWSDMRLVIVAVADGEWIIITAC